MYSVFSILSGFPFGVSFSLGENGAERLLGKGHIAAKLEGASEIIFGQMQEEEITAELILDQDRRRANHSKWYVSRNDPTTHSGATHGFGGKLKEEDKRSSEKGLVIGE